MRKNSNLSVSLTLCLSLSVCVCLFLSLSPSLSPLAFFSSSCSFFFYIKQISGRANTCLSERLRRPSEGEMFERFSVRYSPEGVSRGLDSSAGRALDSWSKDCEFESRQERREIFFSRVNSLFGVRSTPVLPQWHVKDPGHSDKSVGDRLHTRIQL